MSAWNIVWKSVQATPPRQYKCGYCGSIIAAETGFVSTENSGRQGLIYICHLCNNPTYFDPKQAQIPGPKIGRDVEHISDDLIQSMYDEARQCIAANCYTAAVMCCRKLLMHVAVEKGAERKNKTFAYYVEYLADEGYLPPDGKEWVDIIRDKGNEANHEIKIMDQDDAEVLIKFIELLLTICYEVPATAANIKAKAQEPQPG